MLLKEVCDAQSNPLMLHHSDDAGDVDFARA